MDPSSLNLLTREQHPKKLPHATDKQNFFVQDAKVQQVSQMNFPLFFSRLIEDLGEISLSSISLIESLSAAGVAYFTYRICWEIIDRFARPLLLLALPQITCGLPLGLLSAITLLNRWKISLRLSSTLLSYATKDNCPKLHRYVFSPLNMLIQHTFFLKLQIIFQTAHASFLTAAYFVPNLALLASRIQTCLDTHCAALHLEIKAAYYAALNPEAA